MKKISLTLVFLIIYTFACAQYKKNSNIFRTIKQEKLPKLKGPYIYCFNNNGGKISWKKTAYHKDLAKKDSLFIKKIQVKLIKLGYLISLNGKVNKETILAYYDYKYNHKSQLKHKNK